nr:MAG TPA: hypothetical protein [Caudoviricetes sp.]
MKLIFRQPENGLWDTGVHAVEEINATRECAIN